MVDPLAMRLGNLAYDCPSLVEAEVARVQGNAAADAAKAKAIADADTAAFTEQLRLTHEQLARANAALKAAGPPWYAQPWLVAPVAALLGAGVVAYALK